MSRNKWNCFSLRKISCFLSLRLRGARGTVKTIAAAPLYRKVHNTVINARNGRGDACIKMQNRETLPEGENKIRQMPTCAWQPQQNPSNSGTNEVCKIYKCSSASFTPPLSTFRGFYLDRLRVAVRGIVWRNTRWDAAVFRRLYREKKEFKRPYFIFDRGISCIDLRRIVSEARM